MTTKEDSQKKFLDDIDKIKSGAGDYESVEPTDNAKS